MSRAQLTSTTQQDSGGAVAPYLAGKNKIINGDFGIWQRGTSFSHTGAAYTADRFQGYSDATQSYSQQAFTAGSAPVAGYESKYFWRATKTSGTFVSLIQYIENVQTFANQTMTVSFWAKADSNQTVYIRPAQTFAGGSSTVILNSVAVSITTSWSRVSATFAVPSIAGKTLGAGGTTLEIEIFIATNGGVVWDVWGVQCEAGSVATPFTTASNTLQGELALCQRYYYRAVGNSATPGSDPNYGQMINYTNNYGICWVRFPVTMRAIPASVDFANLAFSTAALGLTTFSSFSYNGDWSSKDAGCAIANTSSLGYNPNNIYFLTGAAGTNSYVGFSAEL
jgi:Carbohydrate binding domain